MLQVFSVPWCPACKQVKQFLDQNNIKFKEKDINIDHDVYDILKKLRLHSIPITYLNDENYVVGVDLKKILELTKSKIV